jgi:NADH-quinone oxidoreductase subunit L
MRKMGGIWKKIPFTYAYMWIGSLALAGFPFFAGYYSKDIILEAVFGGGSTLDKIAFILGTAAAFMTAFYSWRLLFMTFHGTPRASSEVMHHVHESPAVMLAPLLLLAAGALISGWLGEDLFNMVAPDGKFWNNSIDFDATVRSALEHAEHVPEWAGLLPTLMCLGGIALAYLFYIKNPALPGKLVARFPTLYRFLLNKWYIDELYDAVFVEPAKRLGSYLWKFWDMQIIDGLGPNGLAWLTAQLGTSASRLQTGYLYHYAFVMLAGLVLIVGSVIYMGHGW